QRRTLARDGHPALGMPLEDVQCRPAETFAAAVAEQNKSIVRPEGGRIACELESADRPSLQPRAAKHELPRQGAVIARSSADQEDPRAATKPSRRPGRGNSCFAALGWRLG